MMGNTLDFHKFRIIDTLIDCLSCLISGSKEDILSFKIKACLLCDPTFIMSGRMPEFPIF